MSKNTQNAKKSETPKSETPKSETKKAGLVLARKITLKPLQRLGFQSRARIGGRVTKTEAVTTQYGESVRFLGDIALKVSESGKFDDAVITRAGVAFLPKAAESVLSGALAGAMNDENFRGLEFAFEIRKVEDETVSVGYTWEVSSLLAPQESEDKTLALLA